MTAHSMDAAALVAVAPRDLATLLLWAFRYALGRETYAPSTVADLWRAHAAVLPDESLRQCVDDVCRGHDAGTLGAACDARTWSELGGWCAGELMRRRDAGVRRG